MGERRAKNKTPLVWDDPLPTAMMNRWTRWRDSLVELEHLSIPHCYHPKEFGTVTRAELQYSRLCGTNCSYNGNFIFIQQKVN